MIVAIVVDLVVCEIVLIIVRRVFFFLLTYPKSLIDGLRVKDES